MLNSRVGPFTDGKRAGRACRPCCGRSRMRSDVRHETGRAYCRSDPAEARAHIADRAGVTTPLTESPAGRVQHVRFGYSGSAIGIDAVTTDALNGPKALCWTTSGCAIGGLRFGLPAALVFSLSSSALL